jgi:dolichol-phosphate mannosyltransferase
MSMMTLSIIIPTYNESQNILNLLNKIRDNLKGGTKVEVVVVDDNSPDGTGRLVEEYARGVGTLTGMTATIKSTAANYENDTRGEDNNNNNKDKDYSIKVIHRDSKYGLISAILQGIRASSAEYVLVMDADFSHPPEVIPKMIDEIENSGYDVIIGSRYTRGGSIIGWPFRRRMISRGATTLAQYGLKVRIKDPMSGFFLCKRHILQHIDINSEGYKILLEILVKKRGIKLKEIPYTFVNRKLGESKMDLSVISDYLKAVWILYRYGRRSRQAFSLRGIRKSISFFSKAARFYTVGASGLLINYSISSALANGLLANISYMNATLVGIICSITSNFLLNKRWTFEDKDFSSWNTLKQYGMFAGISSMGASLQLLMVYLLTEAAGFNYQSSLFIAVAIASVSNFLLNKKWTFQERIWE